MAKILKRNSTYAFQFGPFVKSTDGWTPSTGETISSNAVVLSKDGSSFVSKDDGNALTGTDDTRGFYTCRFNSTDLNTPGNLTVYCKNGVSLPVWEYFYVVSSHVYNAIWSSQATEYLGVDVVAVGGSTRVLAAHGIIAQGVAQAADSTSITLASSHAFANDELNGAVVFITGDTGFGQSRIITDYVGASDKAQVDAWTTTPAANAPYLVFVAPPASTAALPQVNVVRMDTNVLSGEAVSAAAVTKISSGLATDTAMSTRFAALSTQVSALSTTVQAESTRLSTAIYGESTKLSTQIAAIAGGSTLTAAEVATAVMGSTVDGAYTLRQMTRGMGAVLLGKVSGSSGSTTVFRDVNDTKARITAVTDTSGNRTSITLDLD